MLQNTISVDIVDNTIRTNEINYFIPLLLYKTQNLKERPRMLTALNYTDKIDALEKETGKDAESGKDKTLLKDSLGAYFSEDASKYAKLHVYKNIDTIKKFLKKEQYPFVVFIPEDDKDGKDFKEDYKKLAAAYSDTIFEFPTKEGAGGGELSEPFKTAPKGVILTYNKDTHKNLYLKVISQYLYQASSFVAVNRYGIQVKGIEQLVDDTTIDNLRKKNINFYSLLNETGRDGILSLKEGKDLLGIPIDRLFTEYYIKNEAIKELITVWQRNNRLGSKLSEVCVGDDRPNIYTATLDCFFKELKDRRLIVYYGDIRVEVRNEGIPVIRAYVTIKYNDSINKVVLEIVSEDLNTYLRRNN